MILCITESPSMLTGPSGLHYVQEERLSPMKFNYTETTALPPVHAFIWELNGTRFNGNSRIALQDRNATLVVRRASLADSGNYTLTAVNEVGNVSLNLELVVLCMCACCL